MARIDEPLIAHLRELLDPLGRFTARAMFGGWGVYLDGLIIGIVDEGRFYLKTDIENQGQFAQAGSAPFVYMSKEGPMAMSYWSIPDEALEATELMAPWARLALAASLRKQAAKPSKKPKAAKPATKAKSVMPAAARHPAKARAAAAPKQATRKIATKVATKSAKRSKTIAGSMAAKADRRKSR